MSQALANAVEKNAGSRVREGLEAACKRGDILKETRDNALRFLEENNEAWVAESLAELIDSKSWTELNDRFYKTLAFGTGGLRGRTIGNIVTAAERGTPNAQGRPQHPAAGTNCLNNANVRRATQGLVDYVVSWKKKNGSDIIPRGEAAPPVLVFAHDTRHFSREFAELAARTVADNGGTAWLFESERSTPELSFAVRQLEADAGVVITASHNPAYDNGYKAYFADGAQVVAPHADGIIECVNKAKGPTKRPGGTVKTIGKEMDEQYIQRLKTLLVEPELVRKNGGSLKIIYTPLHGTGIKIIPPLLKELGFNVIVVPEQAVGDGRFATLKSPNPENPEALALGIQLAEKEKADLVIATDPDADRMGVAVRTREGKMELLTGNQIGSILANYRLDRMFENHILSGSNHNRACIIKTFVTTDLQRAIAEKFHVRMVETLTGFKYIGQKLKKYEEMAVAAWKEAGTQSQEKWKDLSEERKRALLLDFSYYYVFGGEESYGYSASDFVRDKDANAAALMFAELAVFARSRGLSVADYLQEIYRTYGYYQEKLGQLVYTGAEGAAKIKKFLRSYEENPPKKIHGLDVVSFQDHAKEEILDIDGDVLPKELMFVLKLSNGTKFAVRGSGTEPKIKFYFFASRRPEHGEFTDEQVNQAKVELPKELDALWESVKADAEARCA
jgi:phosphoglucomutase